MSRFTIVSGHIAAKPLPRHAGAAARLADPDRRRMASNVREFFKDDEIENFWPFEIQRRALF